MSKMRNGAKRRIEDVDGELRGSIPGCLGGAAPPFTETMWCGEWAPSELDLNLFPSAADFSEPFSYRRTLRASEYQQRHRADMTLKRALARLRDRGGL